MPIIILILFIVAIAYFIITSQKVDKQVNLTTKNEIEKLLETEIDFFKAISSKEKQLEFKNRVIHFIETTRFTDVGEAKHTLLDEVMIAASGIIPLYHFPTWEYKNLSEIILYKDHFDGDYKVESDHRIMGMVGNGALNQTMVLSLRALREGFEARDGSHTALHEFVHLIDKADGNTDGIPEYLFQHENTKLLLNPWLRLMRQTIAEIQTNESEINPYGATNEAEFFAVISEYFFEKPQLLQRNHPTLYNVLCKIFNPNDSKGSNKTEL